MSKRIFKKYKNQDNEIIYFSNDRCLKTYTKKYPDEKLILINNSVEGIWERYSIYDYVIENIPCEKIEHNIYSPIKEIFEC